MYEYDEVRPRKHSEDGQMKNLVQTLNLMNSFLLLLVMSYMGSRSKILRISWYSSIKLFQTNLKLVIITFSVASMDHSLGLNILLMI